MDYEKQKEMTTINYSAAATTLLLLCQQQS
jgi:hypothetical protein